MKKISGTIILILSLVCSAANAQSTFLLFDESGDESRNISITSERTVYNTKDYKSVLTGNVRISQDINVVTCDKVTIYFSEENNSVQLMDLEGNVYMENETSRAFGEFGKYDATSNTVTLTGNVRYFQNQLEAQGDKFVYNIETGEGTLESGIEINIEES